MRIRLKYIVTCFVLGIIIYVARSVVYLLSEFVLQTHTYTETSCHEKADRTIPKYIHQIYYPIKSPTLRTTHLRKADSWKRFHLDYQYMLWNESAVIDLIRKDHPNLLSLYRSYGHWVQRIDVAKYVILNHYGGWYIDLDITCRRSVYGLDDLMMKSNKSVVVHAEDTIGPATDFFGVSPKHPFMKFILDGLPASNKWFLLQHTNIMFSTGPSFLWGRYLNYPCKDDILILSLEEFGEYARLSHDNSWWGQDTRFIYYALDHKMRIFTIALVIVAFIILLRKTRSVIYTCLERTFKMTKECQIQGHKDV